jgi:hypothetical protein
LWDEEIGFDVPNKKMEALYCRLDPVVAVITNTPAQGLADLALKANAVASAWEELWQQLPEELDYPDRLVRNLIENICGVAGVNLAVSQRLAPRTDLN